MKKCRDCDNEVTTNFANLCNVCLHAPISQELDDSSDDYLPTCGLCENHAPEMFGKNLRIIKRNGDKSLLRCSDCGYSCGSCEQKIDPDEHYNSRILSLDFSNGYLRCHECSKNFTGLCPRCEKEEHIIQLKDVLSKTYPPKSPECKPCLKLSNYERKLGSPSEILQQYNPEKKFKNSNPIIVEIMNEIPKFIDRIQKRRDIEYIKTDEQPIITTVKIRSLGNTYSHNQKVKIGYHRSWKKVLHNYERFLSKNYRISRIEVDTWKRKGVIGTKYEENSYFNYPVIIHYHLLPLN